MKIIDPRQALALKNYKSPSSETFGNLSQSMLKAGYGESYALNISSLKPAWLTENLKSEVARVKRAEKNMDKYLNIDIKLETKKDIDTAKLQWEVSKFILKTIAKEKYSEGEEDQAPASLTVNIVNYNQATDTKDPPPIDVQPL